MLYKICTPPILCFLSFFLTVSGISAKVSIDEARKLGNDLTPLGAIKVGNKEGTIPAWEGGITNPPTCYKPQTFHCDPFAADKPLFTITAENVAQHKEKLSPGQVAMFDRYSTWRMNIYSTRRSASYPQYVYDRTIANATTAELADGGNGVVNAVGGVPFPIPQKGVEPIWNHMVRYKGETADQITGQVAPTASGNYTFVRLHQKLFFLYHQQDATPQSIGNMLSLFFQKVISPARLAGRNLLVHQPINQIKTSLQIWTYNPGQRRVRRAPEIKYDNPGTASDGQRFADQNDMFNGSPDRYDWNMLPNRREMYVPYNSYKLHSGDLQYDDIIKPGHINSELPRYELHRVWVVEATLKKGYRHQYHKRTFYLDEDSWQILVADQYDARGNIWRVSEAYAINFYQVPLVFQTLEVHYDLQNGRYLALGLNNQERPEIFNIKMNRKDFTPDGLRRQGRR